MIKSFRSRFALYACVLVFGNSAFSDELLDIVKDYRSNGINSAQNKIEQILTTKDYWAKVLATQDTDFGYYEGAKYLFVSNKNIPMLWLYGVQNGNLTEIKRLASIVGVGSGAKKKEGDKITPIGVYTFVSRLTNLNQYYGALAMSTNYPNLYDKSLNRTGYGIWIHGMPLNGDKRGINTRGCIAIDNDTLKQLDKLVDLRQTVLISYDKTPPEINKDELANVLSTLYQWKAAWTENDLTKYLSFYSPDFKKGADNKSKKMQNYKEFSAYKKRIFEKKEVKHIEFTGIDISPYPNDEKKVIFVARFNQHYRAYQNNKVAYRSSGQKEVYFEIKDGKTKIIIEK